MEYKVEVKFLQNDEMEQHEYYVSDVECLDKYVPTEAVALLTRFSMYWLVEELKVDVKNDGYADLEFKAGGSSLEMVVKEDNKSAFLFPL